MKTPGYRHFLAVIALLVLTAVALVLQPDIRPTPRAGIRLKLPDRIGRYTGVDLFFCQNEACAASFRGISTPRAQVCEECGKDLDTVSLAERKVLPVDTVILRKKYTHTVNPSITLSIVLSGSEQRSIHRPQACLPAQGMVIEDSRTLSVPMEGGATLKLMLLELRSGQNQAPSCYAYWFVGHNRETPYNMQRLFWMASGRILHNVSDRWAYVAVATARRSGSDEHVRRLQDFVSRLYPELIDNNEAHKSH